MKNTPIHLPLTGLASHLLQDGLLDREQVQKALIAANEQEVALITYLVNHNILTSAAILESCIKSFNLPSFDLHYYNFNWLNTQLLPLPLLKRYRIAPLNIDNGILRIGIADPTDQEALDTIMFHTGLRTTPVVVDENQLNQWLEATVMSQKKLELTLLNKISEDEITPNALNSTMPQDEPVIQFVNQIIQHAIDHHASDIHVEPYQESCRLRNRRDGILYEIATLPIEFARRLLARIKVMAKLDIAERRLPQDGRFHFHKMDIRVNTCPTLFGEKIVLRLLDPQKNALSLNSLGLDEAQMQLFINKISAPHGMILVTGPTGHGKSVTLYSALQYLNATEKNISTVEDPVEMQLAGINQVNIHPKIGLDFATVLRTFLRQDPDVLMVGEIRDKETAEIAIQAALTGHLVLSTLHTNNANEAFQRLASMGIPSYYLTHAITLIIAQRLIRKLCLHCKEPDATTHLAFRAKGCPACLKGYHGRIGVYELLPVNAGSAMTIDPDHSLKNKAIQKVLQGVTSFAEIHRVLQTT